MNQSEKFFGKYTSDLLSKTRFEAEAYIQDVHHLDNGELPMIEVINNFLAQAGKMQVDLYDQGSMGGSFCTEALNQKHTQMCK